MANFLSTGDTRTARLLEKAIITDIGKAVAYTDGTKTFVNTEDNLFRILPDYNEGMLKWLLWHEEYHKQLLHHPRYMDFLNDIRTHGTPYNLDMNEVNIIMDILVHDSLSKMFPELVNTARKNLAQLRDSNSLNHNFKTYTLEDMLKEYADTKKDTEKEGDTEESEDTEGKKDSKDKKEDKDKKSKSKKTADKSHKEDHSSTPSPKEKAGEEEHDDPGKEDTYKPDWSKLKDIDPKEFITTSESRDIQDAVRKLKAKKIRIATITRQLNSLATASRTRTYAKPSYIQLPTGILKGSVPGRAKLALCFDASGSMGAELNLFKNIIERSIPQAMKTPTMWFSGECAKIPEYKDDYYEGTFKDIIPVIAMNGYGDDGDRTLELCLEMEKRGYCPIGITDGGGGHYEKAREVLPQLRHTTLVSVSRRWLEQARAINSKIQVICLDDDEE